MRRREFIASIGVAIAGSPSALAQRGSKQLRIALVHSGIPAADLTESAGPFWVRRFLQELRRCGYVDGENLIVQRYSAEGHQERFAALAREVVTSEPDLIVMNYNVLARAFQAATSTISLVGIVADPVRTGLVPSLARPGVVLPASASTLERGYTESAFGSSRSCSPRCSALRILERPSSGMAPTGRNCALREAISGSLFSASRRIKSIRRVAAAVSRGDSGTRRCGGRERGRLFPGTSPADGGTGGSQPFARDVSLSRLHRGGRSGGLRA